jgi:predicted glycosyltransferase
MRNGRYVFVSHDGFGLGHVRRNVRIAAAMLEAEPSAQITIVTGIDSAHPWLDEQAMAVVRVPPLVKDEAGRYRNSQMSLDHALRVRSDVLLRTVADLQPDAVVIDRHPFGIDGEWRAGLRHAREHGAAVVVGLRDVIDEPSAVRAELGSDRWSGATEMVDEVLVYGSPVICDHKREYGLSIEPTYCGWVSETPTPPRGAVEQRLLVVAAGGGGDGAAVMAIGCGLAEDDRVHRALFVLGPAGSARAQMLRASLRHVSVEVEVLPVVADCSALFATAGVVLTMAGYNSTVEALAVGSRPILMPRRAPRREQAIRASRLASLGLADVVDADAQSDEISWLLDRPRRLSANALRDVGLDLGGADAAAQKVRSLVSVSA